MFDWDEPVDAFRNIVAGVMVLGALYFLIHVLAFLAHS